MKILLKLYGGPLVSPTIIHGEFVKETQEYIFIRPSSDWEYRILKSDILERINIQDNKNKIEIPK